MAGKKVTGRCKLCLREGVELRDSHVMPAGLYRMLYKSSRAKNPTPWLMTQDVEVQTSEQERAHMLCGDCEARLNAEGEAWVFKNVVRPDGSYPLASKLAESIGESWPTMPLGNYYAGKAPKVNVSAITHFAAGIFWRASVHVWKCRYERQAKLGPYEEQFRRYLLGKADFPTDAALWPFVRAKSEATNVCRLPYRKRFAGVHGHCFVMPGLVFNLCVGKDIPTELRQLCFVHGVGNPLLITDVYEARLVQELRATRRVCETRP